MKTAVELLERCDMWIENEVAGRVSIPKGQLLEAMEEYASQFRLSKEKIVEKVQRLKQNEMDECTYGDTIYSHNAVVYGYNEAIEDITRLLKKELSELSSLPDTRDEVIKKQDEYILYLIKAIQSESIIESITIGVRDHFEKELSELKSKL